MFLKQRLKAAKRRHRQAIDCGCSSCKLKMRDLLNKIEELEVALLPKNRAELIAKLVELEDSGDKWSRASMEGKEKLAKIDGALFNGAYHWSVVQGRRSGRTGLSAAIEAGGLAAASSYLKVMQ